jgi:hypothetical protein
VGIESTRLVDFIRFFCQCTVGLLLVSTGHFKA